MRNHHPSSSPSSRVVRPAAAVAIALVALAACGGGKKEPKTLPAQTVSQVAPGLEAPPPLPPPIRELPPPPRPPVKVIDSGDEEPQPKTLLEASQLAKARKGETPPPVVEITDENLSEYAEGGNVIIVESGPSSAPPATPPSTAPPADKARDELYWRQRGLELRRNWRRTLDEIERLELEAASLRQRFYAEDDPYVRDAQIKPAWDRALDRISELRQEAARYQEALNQMLEEGRQLEIPPGWLSEGWELEPSEEERRELEQIPIHRPIDAPVAEEPARDVSGGGGR
ncbi:MAG: hypothetical protein D6696_13240 [Acidobacteria bacterium]|nr:MAG: hypothetical protein D6696_13240 [Acidobacteriota bacterium]